MRRMYLLFIVLAVLLAACGNGEENVKKHTEKSDIQGSQNEAEPEKEAGTVIGGVRITGAGVVTGKCSFINGDVLYRRSNDKVQLLDLNGKETADKLYDKVERLVGDGIVIVSMESEDTPKWGVVNSYTGKELVPCEAVDIQKLNDRYLLVNYYTGAASDDDYYSFYSDGGIIEYNGYGKVLDLKQERFVPGLEVTDEVVAAGDMLYVDREISEVEVFDAEGKSLGTYEYLYAYPDSGISLQAGSTGFTVYDGSFQKVCYINGSINEFKPIDGVDNLLIKNYKQIVDMEGEAVTDSYYNAFSADQNGFSTRKNEDGKTGYVSLDGTELVPFEYESTGYVEPGYLWAKVDTDMYDIYSIQGEKLNTEPVKFSLGQCAFYTENGLFAPDTGKTVELTNKQYLGYGLVKETKDAYTSTIYCARTGEVVFEDVEACVCIGENLYIWDGENEVYNRYILSWA